MIPRILKSVLLYACSMALLPIAHAQMATERYIPIGKSPGVADQEVVVGTITEVDYETRSVQVRSPKGLKTLTMSASTRYYLDRTKGKRSNKSATITDCRVGRKVEIKYDADASADWVKIEVD